jgi:hypothetical protein
MAGLDTRHKAMKKAFETFGEFSAEWLAEQRELVQRAIWRGWIKPPTIDQAGDRQDAPAANLERRNHARASQNRQNGVASKKPATLKSRARDRDKRKPRQHLCQRGE